MSELMALVAGVAALVVVGAFIAGLCAAIYTLLTDNMFDLVDDLTGAEFDDEDFW